MTSHEVDELHDRQPFLVRKRVQGVRVNLQGSQALELELVQPFLLFIFQRLVYCLDMSVWQC